MFVECLHFAVHFNSFGHTSRANNSASNDGCPDLDASPHPADAFFM